MQVNPDQAQAAAQVIESEGMIYVAAESDALAVA